MRKSNLIACEMADQTQQKRAESAAKPPSELARKVA